MKEMPLLYAVLLARVSLGLAAGNGDGIALKVTPVQKVIQLLKGMLDKGAKEMKMEQVQFASYKQWCNDIAKEKHAAIEKYAEQIELAEADILEYSATIETLAKKIAALEADITVWNADVKAATKVRKIEKADYDIKHKDLTEAIDAIREAIDILQKQNYDRKQSDKSVGKYGNVSLMQVSTLLDLKIMSAESKRIIHTYLARDPTTGLEVSAPEANAYEFRSQGIIDMLKKLLDKFVDELAALEKAENNAIHAYEMLMTDLRGAIEAATNDLAEKKKMIATTKQDKANREGDLVDLKAMKVADEKYLADVVATCEQKGGDFVSRQGLRAEELEAITKAIEIISGSAVKGNAEKHLPSLLESKTASLAQLRAESVNPSQRQVSQYLHDRAKQIHSRILSNLAMRVAADPFKKVIKMIKDLIVKLMEQAGEEATHKGWCDVELSTNEQTRKEKTLAVEVLHAEVDELEASIAKVTEDIAALSKAVADLDAAMAKATEVRAQEKAKNQETIEDAKEAQDAVAQALTVLKEFYAKAAEATALVQRQPEIFDSPYKGMGGSAGGVVGMLEVIASDFARLEADTVSAETTAQKEYNEFMTDSEVDKATKVEDLKHKTAKKQDHEQALVAKKEDLDGTQKELDAALDYYEKLKPDCVDAAESYEERVARRKEEIESLQEALRILNGE